MTATVQLLLALGLGRYALLADLALTAVVTAVALALVLGGRRPGQAAGFGPSVVAEAEAVVADAPRRQPV